jgi:phosphoribosylglycinamide formyltransferase-1
MSEKAKLAVFVSGSGSNLQSLIDSAKKGELAAEVVLVVSNKKKAYGLERARQAGIETFVCRVKDFSSKEEAESKLVEILKIKQVEYIALAGYLRLLPDSIVTGYRGRITNIHPALLPKYGGKGMYGHFVHEAVLAAGDAESGATVHLVDEIYDHGKILMQERVPVKPGDTPETLAARVLKVEHRIYPKALENLIQGKYD